MRNKEEIQFVVSTIAIDFVFFFRGCLWEPLKKTPKKEAPILFSFGFPVCNVRPIYIYIYIYIYNIDLKKSLIIGNLYNSNREV